MTAVVSQRVHSASGPATVSSGMADGCACGPQRGGYVHNASAAAVRSARDTDAHTRLQERPGFTRTTRGLGRVLVVDDDKTIRQLIAANLILEGFDVVTAVDGQDCLDKAAAIAPDVITLDVMMPRLDGWETAAQLRGSPQTRHIKLVLISAREREEAKVHANNVSADAYLAKPFDPANMIRVIRRLVGAAPTYD